MESLVRRRDAKRASVSLFSLSLIGDGASAFVSALASSSRRAKAIFWWGSRLELSHAAKINNLQAARVYRISGQWAAFDGARARLHAALL